MSNTTNTAKTSTDIIYALIDWADVAAAACRFTAAMDFVAAAFVHTSHDGELRAEVVACAEAIVEVAYRNGYTRSRSHKIFWTAVGSV